MPFQPYDRRKARHKGQASAVWCLQMMHQSQLSPKPNVRLVVCDNFYTRYVAKQVEKFTESEIELLGIVRLNNLDAFNRLAVKEATNMLLDQHRGSRFLVQA